MYGDRGNPKRIDRVIAIWLEGLLNNSAHSPNNKPQEQILDFRSFSLDFLFVESHPQVGTLMKGSSFLRSWAKFKRLTRMASKALISIFLETSLSLGNWEERYVRHLLYRAGFL